MTPEALYIIYALVGLGAAAVALCLPSDHPDARRIRLGGTLLGIAALAGLAVYLAQWVGPACDGRGFFVIFAIVAVFSAARVITHPRPVYSALYFVLVVLAVTGLCILAAAEFLGIALVIVYAGAIMVTYVFVIMLAQQSGVADYDRQAREPFAAVAMGFALIAVATQAMATGSPTPQAAGAAKTVLTAGVATTQTAATPVKNDDKGNVRAVGEQLMTTYVVAVEVAGVLLLVAVVGAIAIAQKRIEPEAMTPLERTQQREDEGARQIARHAPPF